MYLVDTDVLSEVRKQSKADPGVRAFFRSAARAHAPVFLSVLTIGELRRGIERIRHRGEGGEATRLERWLEGIIGTFPEHILGFDCDAAQLWGAIRLPREFDLTDRQVAATARIHDLTLVSRRARAWSGQGIPALDPFTFGSRG